MSPPLLMCLFALGTTFPVVAGDPCPPWDPLADHPIPPGSGQSIIRDITALSPTNVWAVGDMYTNNIKPFSAHWDGSQWTFVPVPDPLSFADSALWAVGASGPDNIWAAGDREYSPPLQYAFFGTHIFVIRWDGSSWQMMDTPHLGGGSGDRVLGIKVLATDNVWFVGDDHPAANGPQKALAMRWNGSGFQLTDVPIVNPEVGRDAGNTIYDIDDLPNGDLWIVGTTDVTADGADHYSQIHRWDGGQWHHVPGPTPGYFNQLFAVEAIAPDDVWAAGEYWDVAGIFPFLIHWDGSTWTEVPSPGGISDMFSFGPNNIYAVGSRVFHYDGTAWSVVESFPGIVGVSLAGIDAAGPCQLFAGGRQILFNQIHSFAASNVSSGGACYANCDGSTSTPALSVADFTCFLQRFAAGDTRANCDQSTAPPTLNVADFTCFLQSFASGCP